MDSIYYSGSVLAYFATTMLIVFSVAVVYSLIDKQDRTYMDPLSWKLKLLWPFIQIIANFFVIFLPYDMVEKTEKSITSSGVSYLLTAEQYIALRIVSAIIAPLGALFVMFCLDDYQVPWIIAMALLGFMLPTIWLNDVRKKRDDAVIRTLPVYLDFLTMCVEGGLNLQGALTQAMDKGARGPLLSSTLAKP